jgi:hypothetical protein
LFYEQLAKEIEDFSQSINESLEKTAQARSSVFDFIRSTAKRTFEGETDYLKLQLYGSQATGKI